MGRKLKPLMAIAGFFVLARYFPVIYYASQFNDYVKQAPKQVRVGPQLQRALLEKAELYFLPVKPSDIEIKEEGELIQVKVHYKVPVNLFIFKHELSFQASGAGLTLSPQN